MNTFVKLVPLLCLLAINQIPDKLMAQQRPDPMMDRERLEVVKTTFISRQMKLSPEEARLFWPVYDVYQESLKDIRDNRDDSFLHLNEGLDQMSDDEINAMINARMQQAEQALAARKKLISDLREFLPPQKIAIFLRAEQRFNKELQSRMANKFRER